MMEGRKGPKLTFTRVEGLLCETGQVIYINQPYLPSIQGGTSWCLISQEQMLAPGVHDHQAVKRGF
jgi:hypothetical protein